MGRRRMRTAVAVAVLAAGCLAAGGGTAVAAAGGDATGCALPLSDLSLLGVKAAPDSLGGACDALKTDGGHDPGLGGH
ncbi:hypothetical protein POF50_034185 [Streptomyces sp. SL13]|uniref:DUF3558 domain-containing protein n=1 Tax=Streptantibioticus silvisoli TaxID=2705255 RepID=A0AA90KKA1_9ACTN|nr:hypothetical protein [Streptantibioticus silvisoli]MDI5961802.1 hypothetical protein [Streptantibioticus silvisoli]MDI5974339.1 hypothetical protein [Streptantibioticus silvisoli]